MVALTWQILSRWPESELGRLDTAITNLICSGGLPGASALNIDDCRRTLDKKTAAVRAETERKLPLYYRQPSAYRNSEAFFRMLVLTTVLQRDFGIHCSQRMNAMPDSEFFSKPEHLFLHGVIETRAGSCSSLPPMYAAVGRRLGYPLKLVTTCQHAFLRWDAPNEVPFNIECTAMGFVSHPDEYYRTWPRKLSTRELRNHCFLQSLTPRQEFAVYVCNRGHVCLENDDYSSAVDAYAGAGELHPENWGYSHSLVNAMNRWKRRLQIRMGIGFPGMQITFPPRQFAAIPVNLEQGIFHLRALQHLLLDARLDEKWWKPLRSDPGRPPADLPAFIFVKYPQKAGEPVNFIFAKNAPAWYNPKNLF